jgi:hypothetical protein
MASPVFTPRPVRKGVWFPAVLALLLIALLPGLVLLVLSLLGRETTVNAWLEHRLSLSYHFVGPLWLGLVLLLIPPALILLYFLKLKRRPLQVPSTFLWRKSIEDLHVNSLFQWLRDNILLLIQLLAVLILLYALLGLQVHGSSAQGKYYILLIDNSASMAVTDVSPSRLEAARQEALREIDAHADDDTGMVIAFNARASILQPYTRDRGLLRRAVQSIAQTQRQTRIDEALTLADSLANPLRSVDDAAVRPEGEEPGRALTYVAAEGIAAEVHLFSDGRFSDVPSFTSGNLNLNYHRIGASGVEAADNVGIVALNAVRDEQDPARVQVFARVLNFRSEPADIRVELEWRSPGQDGFSLREARLSLPGRTATPGDPERNEPPTDVPGEAAATFELGEVDDSSSVVVHARLRDVQDSFPLDDQAWLVVGTIRKARVLIVTEGNEVLRDFFDQEATTKVAAVSYLKPADLADEKRYRRPGRQGQFDLVIFDRCAPDTEQAMPLAATFFIDAVPPPWRRADMPALKDVQIRNPASRHPLMRHLTGLEDIALSEAFRFDLADMRVPPRTPRLLETGGETAVLFLLERRAFPDLVMTFPLVNARGEWATTWPLKLSFPVFLRNVLYQLGHVSDSAAEENVPPGQVKPLRPNAAVTSVEVFDPDGVPETVARGTRGDFPYKSTDKVGVYRVAWPGGQSRFAVNQLDADESNIRPRDEVRLGSQSLTSTPPRRQTYDTWKWGALAALVLLLAEWVVYHRRVFF